MYTFAETDIINLAGIAFKQTTNGGNIYIDAFRVSTSWDYIPLPVQLSTFTCSADEQGVTLKWKTETEIDNFGFEVQRKEENSEWSNRIFIDGAGNSNAPNYYSFVDNELNEPGIYYYRLKQIDNSGDSIFSDSISADTRLAGSFQLFPNYPNPFNPSTTIHFLLPGTGFTSLAVYNLLGERVRQLKESIMYAGFYSITFDGSDLNSGIYFCVLEHSGIKRVIKLLLVK